MTTDQLRKAIWTLSKSNEDKKLIISNEHVNLSKTNRLDAYEDEEESFHRSLALRFMELASEIDEEIETHLSLTCI